MVLLQNTLDLESTQHSMQPNPLFTPDNLAGNKLTADIPFCMPLTARHHFGPVKAHRYFMCPENMEDDRTVVSQTTMIAQRVDQMVVSAGRRIRSVPPIQVSYYSGGAKAL
jgi:hypothetical protein